MSANSAARALYPASLLPERSMPTYVSTLTFLCINITCVSRQHSEVLSTDASRQTCIGMSSWMHLGLAIQCEVAYAHLLYCRFTGVSRAHGGIRGRWSSVVCIKGPQRPLGEYSTEELAAQAYDRVCIYQASTTSSCEALSTL